MSDGTHSNVRFIDDEGKSPASVVLNLKSHRAPWLPVEEDGLGIQTRLHEIVQNIPLMIAVFDENGRVKFWNRESERFTGYSQEEIMAADEPLELLFPDPEYCSKLRANWRNRDELHNLEVNVTLKDGSVRTVFCTNIKKPSPILGWRSWVIALDITEQKKSAAFLIAKNWALKSSVNGIALADLDGNLTYVNDSFLNMWGYSDARELLGRSTLDFWQNREEARGIITALHDKGDWEGELVARKCDQSLFDVQLSASIVRDLGGRPICMMATFIDITARKEAEKIANENKRRLRAILDASMSFEALLDPEGNILTLNKTAVEYLGASEDELIGLDFFSTLDPEVREHRKSLFNQVLTTGKPLLREIERSGNTYDVSLCPVFNDERKVTAVAVYIHGTTERTQAEKALKQSEEKYRNLIENIPDVVWSADEAGIVYFLSPNVAKIYGASPEEILNMPRMHFFKRVHPEDLARVRREYAALFKEKKKLDIEYRVKTRDGRWIWVHDRSLATYVKDGVRYANGIFSDITEKKEAEIALKKKEEELKIKNKSLMDAKTALEVLLRKRDEDRAALEENIVFNVNELVTPYFQKLRNSGLNDIQETYVSILESSIKNFISPFSRKVSSKYLGFTPVEIQVADLVKRGKTTKDIAKLMHSSDRAVEFHRSNIRKKLGLNGKKINLRSYLLSMD